MPLTTEQLREALGLIDTMISCNARLQADIQDDRWRSHLESSIATCSEKIQAYLDSANQRHVSSPTTTSKGLRQRPLVAPPKRSVSQQDRSASHEPG